MKRPRSMEHLRLGASLYVPTMRTDMAEIANGRKLPFLRSVIFCQEDAVLERDVPTAMTNLQSALRQFAPSRLARYVRVRNAALLRETLRLEGVDRVDGFVLPKVTSANLDEYLSALPPRSSYRVMLTLETEETFDAARMQRLRSLIVDPRRRKRILALRIGGNDLFHLLGLRRPRDCTVYETPLGWVISQLVTIFLPFGIPLTAPVFEHLDDLDSLALEARRDVSYGLIGKTAIHPDQVPVIEAQYSVTSQEMEAAERVLDAASPAVFRCHDSMCEPTTHRAWAETICHRRELYGLDQRPAANPLASKKSQPRTVRLRPRQRLNLPALPIRVMHKGVGGVVTGEA